MCLVDKKRIRKKVAWVDPEVHVSVCERTITAPVNMHLHDYFELEIIISGTGQHNLNGTVYPVGPGTVYLITPIDFHSIVPDGSLRLYNISFDETILSPALWMRFLNRRENLIFSDADGAGHLCHLARKLADECEGSDCYALQARKNLLELLLFAIARSSGGESGGLPALNSGNVQNSIQYLFQHFRDDITLEEVASQSGYTANYFSYLFHQISGQKYVDFLTRLRLNYAKTMLLNSDESIARIADASGFSSQSNFFRSFRKELGLSPVEYRKHHWFSS